MTAELINMARAAGFGKQTAEGVACIERFAALVAAAKQEQCAKACEAFGKTLESDVGENFAEEIRALKDGGE